MSSSNLRGRTAGAGGKSWSDLKSHITTVEVEGVRLRVLDLAGLLETKRGLRPKDQSDAELIERALAVLRGN